MVRQEARVLRAYCPPIPVLYYHQRSIILEVPVVYQNEWSMAPLSAQARTISAPPIITIVKMTLDTDARHSMVAYQRDTADLSAAAPFRKIKCFTPSMPVWV